MKQVFLFLRYFKNRRWLIFAHLLLQVAISIVLLAVPEVLRIATDAIALKNVENLNRAIILAIAATFFHVVFTSIDKPLEAHIKNKCTQDMQNAVINKMLGLKRLELSKYSSGDIITKVTQNAAEAVNNSLSTVFDIFQGICLTVSGVLYMGFVSFRLMVIVVPYYILLKIFIDSLYNKIKNKSKRNVAVTKRGNSFLIDILSSMDVIKAFDKREFFAQRLSLNENELMKINIVMHVLYGAAFYIMLAMNKIAEFGIIYALGGYWVYKGIIGFGVISAYSLAMDRFEKGMRPLVWGISGVAAVVPHIENITSFLNNGEGCEVESESLTEGDSSIIFENVSFSFADGESRRQIFNGLNLRINPGEKIMLRGENGKGKSTLLRLITGLYRPDAGRVIIGGQDTTSVNIDSIAQKCCYISQTSDILDGGIYENLALNENYDKELCEALLDMLNMPHVAANKPETLSQGEKQRLNIGRALYKSQKVKTADIILGDEIFSNVDSKNKEEITAKFFRQFESKTVVLVCHDNVPYKFDRIITVGKDGIEVHAYED